MAASRSGCNVRSRFLLRQPPPHCLLRKHHLSIVCRGHEYGRVEGGGGGVRPHWVPSKNAEMTRRERDSNACTWGSAALSLPCVPLHSPNQTCLDLRSTTGTPGGGGGGFTECHTSAMRWCAGRVRPSVASGVWPLWHGPWEGPQRGQGVRACGWVGGWGGGGWLRVYVWVTPKYLHRGASHEVQHAYVLQSISKTISPEFFLISLAGHPLAH